MPGKVVFSETCLVRSRTHTVSGRMVAARLFTENPRRVLLRNLACGTADSRKVPPRGFRVLARRWVVERTFAWISHNRRMGKDYEKLCATGEAFVYVAMTRLMVRRLARA